MLLFLPLKCQRCGAEVVEPSRWRRGAPCAACDEAAGWECSLKSTSVPTDSVEMISTDDAFNQVWLQLAFHTHPGHSPLDTLNRLLTKHFEKRFEGEQREPPTLHEEHLKVRFEWWPTQAIDSLWRGHQRTRSRIAFRIPMIINLPVIVLNLGVLDCVIDGNTRINKRIADSVPEPHRIYLLEYRARY